MNVFEDFARRCVRQCIRVIIKGGDIIKRRNASSHVHGDLFLIRHLLILREQLGPFELKLQSVEKSLDFKSTNTVLRSIAMNPRNLIRFDNHNSILQIAREGLPSTLERQVGATQLLALLSI
jgi:hypothetical protein